MCIDNIIMIVEHNITVVLEYHAGRVCKMGVVLK